MARAELLQKQGSNVPEKNYSDFRLEYKEKVPDQALINEIVSYLGEYRFRVPKFNYQLEFSGGRIKDPQKKELMLDTAERALSEKISNHKNYSRELAEKRGIESLEHQLNKAEKGDTIFWASPPGPEEEGYGDYGFVFVGRFSGKELQMTAVRIDSPKIEQFNEAMRLFTKEKTNYKTAEEFIANPKTIKEQFEEGYADALLNKAFLFKPNKEEQEKFNQIMLKMSPLIRDFVQSAKDPFKSKAEKIKELYSLENYALKLKADYSQPSILKENVVVDFRQIPRLADIRGKYGYEPPKVAGSCPSANKSSNLFSKGSFINSLLNNSLSGEQEWFHCPNPKCGYVATGPIGNTCPGCGLTKEQYAQETGISCD
jgi:hypothetical protein